MEKSVHKHLDKVADDIGNAIGTRMAENMGRSFRRRAGDAIGNSVGSVRRSVSDFSTKLKGDWEKVSKRWSKQVSDKFGKLLKPALFSAISLAAVALPSALAFVGAIAGAMVATIIPAIASIGPAAAGAGLAFVAAFSSMKITAGLVGLALKAQTPALKDFQKRVKTFKESIATPIQAGMLSGFNAAIRIAKPIIAGLNPMLKELGTNVGDIAIHFADTFRQGANLQRLQRILTANNDAVKIGGQAATSLAVAFSVLLDHLSPITLFLAGLVRDMSAWAQSTILAAEASGQLDGFITRMFNGLRRFVGILVDFGIGIWNVFRAAFNASGGMVNTLSQIARHFREWTGDPANQDRMIAFFDKMRVITGRVLQIFGQLSVASGKALAGTNVDSVLTGLNTLVRVGMAAGRMFSQIRAAAGPGLSDAFKAFSDMMINLANSGVLGSLSQAFAELFRAISLFLTIPGMPQLLTFVVGLASLAKVASLVTGIFKPLGNAIQLIGEAFFGAEKGTGALRLIFQALKFVVMDLLLPALEAVVAVVGWIPLVIAAVVAALVWFFTQTEIGRKIIGAVWAWIKNAISVAVDGIVAAWNWMVGIFRTVWQWISNIAQQIWQSISTAFNAVVNVVTTVFTAIWNVIKTIFGVIWTIISSYLGFIWGLWSRIFLIMLIPLRILWGVAILIWNAIVTAITVAVQAIWSVITTVWNAIWGWLQPILTAIWQFIVNTWNTIYHAIASFLSAAWAVITTVWNAIWGFISGVMHAIGSVISGAWNAVYGAVSGALNRVWGVIKSIWNGITGFIQGAMDKIGNIIGSAWDFMAGVGDTVLGGIKDAINTVIGVINHIIDGLNWVITQANKLPGPDIPKIPAIPKLAQGGVVSPNGGGTLAMIAEAGRPERVEPLDPQGLSRRDRAMINQLAGSGGDTLVIVKIGETELRGIVSTEVKKENGNVASALTTGRKAS